MVGLPCKGKMKPSTTALLLSSSSGRAADVLSDNTDF